MRVVTYFLYNAKPAKKQWIVVAPKRAKRLSTSLLKNKKLYVLEHTIATKFLRRVGLRSYDLRSKSYSFINLMS
jgi:hypothetical protein